MILCIDKVLTDDQLQRIRQTLDASDFRDGRARDCHDNRALTPFRTRRDPAEHQ